MKITLYKPALTTVLIVLAFLTGTLPRAVASAPSTVDSVMVTKRRPAEIVTAVATSIAVNAALTELLKHTVTETRPNGDDNHSFPSRHTSWAFTLSTAFSNELYRHSPWWSLGSQTLASAVALQRVASRHHYASDVIAGATLGIASTELSYWLARRIFHSKAATSLPSCFNDITPSLSISSEAIYFFESDLSTGFGIRMTGRLPVSDRWGLAASLQGSSTPVKIDGKYINPFNALGATVGFFGHFVLPEQSLAIEPSLHAGALKMLHTDGWDHSSWGFEGDLDISLNWRLTQAFSFRASAGYRLITVPRATSAITISLGSVACF